MFVDEVKIFARAGHGGKGCVAFHREAYRPKGGPSGGNGGRGGDVFLEADHDLNNLIAQYYSPKLLAEHGEHGLGKGMDGRAGKDLVIKVPCGTLIWKLPEGESTLTQESAAEPASSQATPLQLSGEHRPLLRCQDGAMALEYNLADEPETPVRSPRPSVGGADLVADLTENAQRFLLCKGGRGGLGNRNFATARRQAPRFAQPGEPGGQGHYLFELRMIADVGLVGYPNAGKSTLLSAISAARPKIAPYPFTTLQPQVGIVAFPDFLRLTVCDVPGLIEGSHRNIGLGHAFLRHIQRCKVLVILLDMAGADARVPWDDYKNLLNELELYDATLLDRPRVVVANKMDEPAAEDNLKKFKRRIKKTPVMKLAAAFDQGIGEFKSAMRHEVERVKASSMAST